MTHDGIVARRVINGAINDAIIAKMAVAAIVITDAFPVIATHPTDSPYVVLGHPPKNAPTMEPTPSPRSVLERPGSSRRFCSIIDERFL